MFCLNPQKVIDVARQKILQRYSAGSDNIGMHRIKRLREFRHSVVCRPAPRFYFQCYTAFISEYDKIHFFVSVSPIKHLIIILLRLRDEMCAHGTLDPAPPKFRVFTQGIEVLPLKGGKQSVVENLEFRNRVVFSRFVMRIFLQSAKHLALIQNVQI